MTVKLTDAIAQKIADVLRGVRQIRGMTLRQAAKESGLSNAYISQLENGKVRTPSLKSLSCLAPVYGISLGVLLQCAGYTSSNDQSNSPLTAIVDSAQLTSGEIDLVIQFVGFLLKARVEAAK